MARQAWGDYLVFLNTLEAHNLNLYKRWVQAVARNLIEDLRQGPGSEPISFPWVVCIEPPRSQAQPFYVFFLPV